MDSPVSTRTALLSALHQGPGHGYGLIERVAALTGERLRLQQGAVYPALSRLCEEGFIAERAEDGRARVYVLLPAGEELLDEHLAIIRGLYLGEPAP